MSEILLIQKKYLKLHDNSCNSRMIVKKFNYFNRNFNSLSFSQFWFYSYGKKNQIDLKMSVY